MQSFSDSKTDEPSNSTRTNPLTRKIVPGFTGLSITSETGMDEDAIPDSKANWIRMGLMLMTPNTGNKGTLLRPWPGARMAAQLAEAAVVFPLH